ncbi:MAG: Dickkopf N-terminal cysteine-rich domain-containing protein [Polyangiaceae bacterium]
MSERTKRARRTLRVVAGLLVGAATLALAGSCGVEGSSCRADEECDEGLFCKGPSELNVCGVPPHEECATDQDCPSPMVCHAISDGCSADAVGSRCAAPCTPTSCDAGFRCGAGGSCEPVPCGDAGASCPRWQICDPSAAVTGSPVHARSSGCKRIACVVDAACPPDTACTNGICQDGAGTCREDIAVP